MRKTDKTIQNLYRLIQALKNQPLSNSDIQELLSCNRQSVSNYLHDVETSGCTLIKTRQKDDAHTKPVVYYSISKHSESTDGKDEHTERETAETSDFSEYLPLTKRDLRAFSIIQLLQSHPSTLSELRLRFFIAHPTKNKNIKEEQKKPKKHKKTDSSTSMKKNEFSASDSSSPYMNSLLDIKYTEFNKQVDALIQAGEIQQFTDGTLHPTGRSFPLFRSLNKDELIHLFKQIRTLPQTSPYHSQAQSIAGKLTPVMRTYHIEVAPQSNYLIYGRKHRVLDQINSQLESLSKTDYIEHQIRIQYKTRKNVLRTVLFQTGLILYSVEKTKLYLLGQSVDENRADQTFQDTIIDLGTIQEAADTDAPNNQYRSPYYCQVFDEMFGISLEDPVEVLVHFDDVANIRRKLTHLTKQRTVATCTPIENQQLEYRDTIRGLGDFASYLRQFGKNAHVISPDALKQKMNDSVIKTLQRYEENIYEQE